MAAHAVLNDRSSPLALLETRRSGLARELAGPGPTEAELDQILTIAARAPDHGKLAPWRFVIVGDDQREALAALLRRALDEEDPEALPIKRDKADAFARQGAALVVLISAPVQGHKIPVIEQQYSCGAVGMNLLQAVTALGFAGTWLTGWYAYSPRVAEAFCGPGEAIAGFFFIGRPATALDERPRPPLAQLARRWETPVSG